MERTIRAGTRTSTTGAFGGGYGEGVRASVGTTSCDEDYDDGLRTPPGSGGVESKIMEMMGEVCAFVYVVVYVYVCVCIYTHVLCNILI